MMEAGRHQMENSGSTGYQIRVEWSSLIDSSFLAAPFQIAVLPALAGAQ